MRLNCVSIFSGPVHLHLGLSPPDRLVDLSPHLFLPSPLMPAVLAIGFAAVFGEEPIDAEIGEPQRQDEIVVGKKTTARSRVGGWDDCDYVDSLLSGSKEASSSPYTPRPSGCRGRRRRRLGCTDRRGRSRLPVCDDGLLGTCIWISLSASEFLQSGLDDLYDQGLRQGFLSSKSDGAFGRFVRGKVLCERAENVWTQRVEPEVVLECGEAHESFASELECWDAVTDALVRLGCSRPNCLANRLQRVACVCRKLRQVGIDVLLAVVAFHSCPCRSSRVTSQMGEAHLSR